MVRLDLIQGGDNRTLVPIIGLNDFHGQLDPTTMRMDGINVSVGGAAHLATMFDEEATQFRPGAFLLAAGDNVGTSPANSGLLQDMPAIDVENAWGLELPPMVTMSSITALNACSSIKRALTSPSWAPTSLMKQP